MQVLLETVLCKESACSILSQVNSTMTGDFHFIDLQILVLFHLSFPYFLNMIFYVHFFFCKSSSLVSHLSNGPFFCMFELKDRYILISALSINVRTKFFISSNSDAPILELPSKRNMTSIGLLHSSEEREKNK